MSSFNFNFRGKALENKLKLVKGFSWLGKNIGIKDDSLDFGVLFSEVPCSATGVFTKNNLPGAPVIVGKEHLENQELQAIVVNSKNANVATRHSLEDARNMCVWVGENLGIAPTMVLPSSTGVIGQPLPIQKIQKACNTLQEELESSVENLQHFITSMMTTDTYPKWHSRTIGEVTITGVAKGAGMIEPNMATMLSYIMTDALLPKEKMKSLLTRVVNQSFNRISIDTDTSTSDTVVFMANGLAGSVDEQEFEQALLEICIHLAKEIVRDGEGATKLIELTVEGAESADQALKTAKAMINSPLVKTAIYGADPNWGRMIMAIGKVFEYPVSLEDIQISFGKNDKSLILHSTVEYDPTLFAKISECLQEKEVFLTVVVGKGEYSETVWGCDLTEEYVKANAYYTT